MSNKTNYYEFYATRYLNSDAETRKASKAHWVKTYSESIASNLDEEMINFSARILATIALLESEEK